ncbi:hypothetical protein BH20ACT2_BH20ACT2_07870 [soil metagenome]
MFRRRAATSPLGSRGRARRYPDGAKAAWPLALPAGTPDAEVDRLRGRAEQLAADAQYGWGHTIRFGPFDMPGLLGEKYLRIAGVLDEWAWWPSSLTGLQVADVGCFTGGLSVLMAARGAAHVEAVDEVPEHLAQCDLVAGAFDLGEVVHTHQASLYELADLGAERFDLIMFAGVLYHVSDMLVGLIELQRLLKPGGVLLLESNAVESFEHSYANFGRYYGGMWWQPTALCIADLCEHAGFERAEVAFYQPGRALARVVKPAGATVPFKRGLNLTFEDLRDGEARSLDPSVMAPAPELGANAGMLARWALRAATRVLRLPMQLGYRYRRLTRRSRTAR